MKNYDYRSIFPFLDKMGIDDKTSIDVKPIDVDLLKTSFQNEFWDRTLWDGSIGCNENIFHIFFYNNNSLHKEVVIVGEYYSGSYYTPSQKVDVEGEPIGTALLRFQEKEKIADDFKIIIRNSGYYERSDLSSRWDNITIYIPQKKEDINDMLRGILDEYFQIIREEIKKVYL